MKYCFIYIDYLFPVLNSFVKIISNIIYHEKERYVQFLSLYKFIFGSYTLIS